MHNQANTQPIIGNMRESSGKFYMVPEKEWEKVEEVVMESEELVDEHIVEQKLHIGKKRLKNMISSGEIPRRMYTVCVNGLKKFKIRKIMGLEK